MFCRIIASLMPHDKGNKLRDMAMKMEILSCQTWTLKRMMKHRYHGDHPGPEWNVSEWKRTYSFMGKLFDVPRDVPYPTK